SGQKPAGLSAGHNCRAAGQSGDRTGSDRVFAKRNAEMSMEEQRVRKTYTDKLKPTREQERLLAIDEWAAVVDDAQTFREDDGGTEPTAGSGHILISEDRDDRGRGHGAIFNHTDLPTDTPRGRARWVLAIGGNGLAAERALARADPLDAP